MEKKNLKTNGKKETKRKGQDSKEQKKKWGKMKIIERINMSFVLD